VSESDSWPSRQILTSPFNHNTKAAVGKPHLQPDVSPEIINKIANNMCDHQESDASLPPTDKMCQSMLSGMPDFPEMENPETKSHEDGSNKELDKLLSSGYKPLSKKDGEWYETAAMNNKKIILE